MFSRTLVLSVWLLTALALAGVAPPATVPASRIPLYGSSGEPQEFDVHQALTADCWLEATLAAIVRVNPKTITQLLHDNGDGTVTVFLYHPLTLLAVEPPPKVEKLNFGQEAQDSTSTTTWVQVIQDALNPLVNGTVLNGAGNYPMLALSAIYGEPGAWSTCDQLLSLALLATASPMVFVTTLNISSPLVNDHAYTLENITEIDGGKGVRMRNPWGIVSSNKFGIPDSPGVINLGHGEFEVSNATAQAQKPLRIGGDASVSASIGSQSITKYLIIRIGDGRSEMRNLHPVI